MKSLISLKAFGLSEMDAVRYYTAMLMAERGVVSAPNMAVGKPFNIGGAVPTLPLDGLTNGAVKIRAGSSTVSRAKIARALLDPRRPPDDPVVQAVRLLMSGVQATSSMMRSNLARANDQLVRATRLHPGDAGRALARLEYDYRAEHARRRRASSRSCRLR